MPTIPTITLIRTNPQQDSAAMSIVHNKNAKVIEDALNNLQQQIVDGSGGGTSITQEQFNSMLQNSKNYVMIRANMVNGEYIDFNQYRITRIGTPSGWSASAIEFRVTDLNTTRNTNFRKSFINIRDYNGYGVYPSILTDSTFISIIFSDVADVSPVGVSPASDPNNKHLTIL